MESRADTEEVVCVGEDGTVRSTCPDCRVLQWVARLIGASGVNPNVRKRSKGASEAAYA